MARKKIKSDRPGIGLSPLRLIGLAAEKLEDLKSRSGRPFKEEIPSKMPFRRAIAFNEQHYPIEYAYFCSGRNCGWVSGSPRRVKNVFYCYGCGAELGERKKK